MTFTTRRVTNCRAKYGNITFSALPPLSGHDISRDSVLWSVLWKFSKMYFQFYQFNVYCHADRTSIFQIINAACSYFLMFSNLWTNERHSTWIPSLHRAAQCILQWCWSVAAWWHDLKHMLDSFCENQLSVLEFYEFRHLISCYWLWLISNKNIFLFRTFAII